jgi:hypothetical protein
MTEASSIPVSSRRTGRVAGWMGVVVGVAVVAVLVGSGVLRQDEPPPPDASEELVRAWATYRTGTFVVEGEWRRTMNADGRTLASATWLAQRPPDRIVRRNAGVRGRIGDAVVRCNTSVDGTYACFPSDADAGPYQDEVDEEVTALRSYFTGPRPLYRVARGDDGCFVLDQDAPTIDPPYGSRAVMCFDDATGALRYLERHIELATEVNEATHIRSAVTDADFDLTQDPAYDPRFDQTLGETDQGPDDTEVGDDPAS